eukprot:2611167-Rhodomonas_salina.1
MYVTVQHSASSLIPTQAERVHPEIKYKKPPFQYNLYQECGFLCLISPSRLTWKRCCQRARRCSETSRGLCGRTLWLLGARREIRHCWKGCRGEETSRSRLVGDRATWETSASGGRGGHRARGGGADGDALGWGCVQFPRLHLQIPPWHKSFTCPYASYVDNSESR